MVDGTTREFIAGLINEFASKHILMSLEEILECVEGSKTDVSAFRSLKMWLSNSDGKQRGISRLSKDQRKGILFLAPKRRVKLHSRGNFINTTRFQLRQIKMGSPQRGWLRQHVSSNTLDLYWCTTSYNRL